MNEDIRNDVHLVMQHVYDETTGAKDQEPDEEEAIIHVHHFPDALLFLKENRTSTTTNIPVVESTPKDTEVNPAPVYPAYLAVCIFIVLVLSSILFQLYVLFHPPIATVTIIPKSQQITLTGTLQLGRVLTPITVSQSSTVPTTGHGHQDARAATGSITFYNGQLQSVFVPEGTILTGTNGVQIVTGQDANIPAANPPTWGITTVMAHATYVGSSGNIAAYDINQGCCATAIKAVNTSSFSGGEDERNFQTVAQSDITNTEAPLKATLNQSVQGALHGQAQANEGVVSPSCTATTGSDHRPGEEAATVKVTVSETCSAVAYNSQQLESGVTQLLTAQATTKPGAGYSILGNPEITVTGATTTKQVTLSFHSVSTWIYALSRPEQKIIKKLIAGKNVKDAMQLLSSLPGIKNAAIRIDGFADDTRIPKDPEYIHLMVIYNLYQ